MTYESDHAGALETMAEAGAAVTFTLTSPGTPLPLGGFTGPTTQIISGYAIRVKGEGEDQFAAYESGETTETNPLTLFFVPSTFGQVPPRNSVARWSGAQRKVKKTREIAPDGVAIATYVVLE